MAASSYEFDEEYRTKINKEIAMVARQFGDGILGVIAVSRELRQYQSVVERHAPKLGAILMTFVAVDSETDALPIGPTREMWHPTTIDSEDKKVEQAELMYRESVNRACEEVLRILD